MTQEQLSECPTVDVGNLIFPAWIFRPAEKVFQRVGTRASEWTWSKRTSKRLVVQSTCQKSARSRNHQSIKNKKIKIPFNACDYTCFACGCGQLPVTPFHIQLAANCCVWIVMNSRGKIEWIQSATVYRLRGRCFPLVYLRDQLQIPK